MHMKKSVTIANGKSTERKKNLHQFTENKSLASRIWK